VLALVPLGIVYLVTSYGIVPMVRWASERSVALADSIGSVLRRVLPLLLVSITFLFLAAEAWESWASSIGGDVNVLLSWSLDQHRMVVTEELLRVAGFLATFAGLSFTVYLVTDPTYRNEFRTDVASELREAFGVRAAYRWALAEESSPIAAGPGA
jgi:hypothetical protein